MGVLNLTHHASHEHPGLLEPARRYPIEVVLDQIAYRLPQGHRLRLAISTAYWPFVWPSPQAATVTIHGGELALPIRSISAGRDEWRFAEPEAAAPWNASELRPPHSMRETFADERSGAVETRIDNDFGEYLDLDHGLRSGSSATERWTIRPDDPQSASATIEWQQSGGRDAWRWRTVARMKMHSNPQRFEITGELSAEENGKSVFERDYRVDIERKFV
jgi:hypothetical protein